MEINKKNLKKLVNTYESRIIEILENNKDTEMVKTLYNEWKEKRSAEIDAKIDKLNNEKIYL